MHDLHNFGLGFENIFIIFEISILEFVFKFSSKMKILKFQTKKPSFGYFGGRILKLLSCLK